MNNQLIEANPKESVKWLYNQIMKLCNDYFQEVSDENLKYLANRCCEEGIKGKLSYRDYEKTFNELLVNYCVYRKVTVATIQTALKKINQ